jgi:hypothetical protein
MLRAGFRDQAIEMSETICQSCGAGVAHRYQLVSFGKSGEPSGEREFLLCARCARAERKRLKALPELEGARARQELIAELDRFFASSGASDLCHRCHQQGTGCCPPTCRVMGAKGCDPNNKHGKTVFCAAFVCSALLNAISECDAEAGRALKWVKTELGPAEFRVYQMITRVPANAREPVRPLALPERYPRPTGLEDGNKIKEKLSALADETLEIRRRWRELERQESAGEFKRPRVER